MDILGELTVRGGAVLGIAGCRAASPSSTPSIPVAPTPITTVTTRNASRHCQCPLRAKLLPVTSMLLPWGHFLSLPSTSSPAPFPTLRAPILHLSCAVPTGNVGPRGQAAPSGSQPVPPSQRRSVHTRGSEYNLLSGKNRSLHSVSTVTELGLNGPGRCRLRTPRRTWDLPRGGSSLPADPSRSLSGVPRGLHFGPAPGAQISQKNTWPPEPHPAWPPNSASGSERHWFGGPPKSSHSGPCP